MGKLSDLSDDPLPTQGLETPIDPWRFIHRCKAMELDPRYTFAYDTIAGIRCTVELTRHVTPGQDRAIQNIAAGAQRAEDEREDRRREARRTRRYEGWDGRNR